MHVPSRLIPLFDDGIILEVIRPLMSGKEASVYMVRTQNQVCVAKVYKEANNRSFRQRSAYAEGRTVRNTRQRRAMAKGSKYGKTLLEAEWQNAEVSSLYRLHEVGVRVPIPHHFGENVLIMEMITDEDGNPAPRLWDVQLNEAEALEVHSFLIRQIVRMLCAGLVHGDLSEYNILMSSGGPVIIDLPQATDAAQNQNSERIFLRDVKNLGMFLSRFAAQLQKTQYGPEIWDLYTKGQLHPDSVLTGRFKRDTRLADTAAVLAQIQESADDANARPLSAYQEKRQRKLAEALAEAEAEAEREAKRVEARLAQPKSKSRPKNKPKNKPKNSPKNTTGTPSKERRRRHRRP
jgi:RIO kinase 1